MNKFVKPICVAIACSLLLAFSGCSTKTAVDTTTTAASAAATDVATTESTIDLSEYSFDTMYGSQLNAYLGHTYTFEGEQIPEAEVNFYFINAFLDLSQYAQYGIYPVTSEGYLDLSAEITATEGEEQEYATWGEFFVNYAEQMLASTCVINQLAEEAEMTLSDETMTEIDDLIINLDETGAQVANMTLDDYIKLYYGPTCDEAAFRAILYNYYMADLYTSDYCDNYEFTDEEIMVPDVRYVVFSAAESTATADEIADAEAAADALIAGVSTIEEFESEGAALQDAGECLQYGTLAVEQGTCVQEFEDWVYDESRLEGDIDKVYSPDLGWFVICYVGITELSEDIQDEIAVNAMGEYVMSLTEDGVYEFVTPDDYVAATPVAETTAASDVVETDANGQTVATTATTAGTAIADSANSTAVPSGLIWALAGVGILAILIMLVALVVYFIKLGKDTKDTATADDKQDDKKEDKSEENK